MHLKLSELQAAIVDLDGTMIDTAGDFEVALVRALTSATRRSTAPSSNAPSARVPSI
jgi:beta-phosphoglucomutase-like phosphatase (HAD superfamily)